MTGDEVEKAIQDADKKLTEYRDQLVRQGKTLANDAEYKQLKARVQDLVRKHRVTGASGTPCGCCGGTGRE